MAQHPLTPAQIQGLHARMNVDPARETEILAFLTEKPHLLDLLYETADQITSYFPGATQQLVELNDPAYEAPCLGLVIQTPWELSRVKTTLDAFDTNWWNENYDRSEGELMVVSLSMVNP